MTPERLAELRQRMADGERLDCSPVFWQKLCEEMLDELARLRRVEEAARYVIGGVRDREYSYEGYSCLATVVNKVDIVVLKQALDSK